jgi:hypothetical protein
MGSRAAHAYTVRAEGWASMAVVSQMIYRDREGNAILGRRVLMPDEMERQRAEARKIAERWSRPSLLRRFRLWLLERFRL